MGDRFEKEAQSVIKLYQNLKYQVSDEVLKNLKLNNFEKYLKSNKENLLYDGIFYLF